MNQLNKYTCLVVCHIIVDVINLLSIMVHLVIQKMTITDASLPSIYITEMSKCFELEGTLYASIPIHTVYHDEVS